MRVTPSLSATKICTLLALTVALAGCGAGTGGKPFPPPPPTTSTEYVFATSNSQVSSFNLNATTGALATPAKVTGPTSSSSLLVSPSGKFVYVSDGLNAAVDIFSVGSTNGALTQVNGSPFSVGAIAFGMAMDPGGKFLYVVDGVNAQVLAFTVNGSTGMLTAVSGTPVVTANGPVKAVVDPSGQFLFVADNLDALGGISAYTINSSTGALTAVQVAPFPTNVFGGPEALAVHPNGQFLYVADSNLNSIYQLSISNTGSLTTVVGSPFATGNRPGSLAIDPAGKFLYAANGGDTTISAYTIDPTSGELTQVASSPFAAGTASGVLAVDPSGKFLYAANSQLSGASTITGFTINSSTGALTPFSGQPSAAGNGPVFLTVANLP